MAQKTALDEYLAFEAQALQLKEKAIRELEDQKRALQDKINEIENTLTGLRGTHKEATPEKDQRTRTSITIDQVKAAIRGGATTYRAIAKELGCVPATVKAKVEFEGKHVGISSTGARGTFTLHAK